MREKRRGKVRTPYIETERLIVSLWEEKDEFLGYALFGNEIIASYWTRYIFTKDDIDSIIRKEKLHFKDSKMCLFPIFTKDKYAFIGVCGIHKFKEHYQFVIIFLPHQWHQGYGQEVGKAIIDYAFDELQIPYLIAARCEDDEYCEYVYKKLGFQEVRNCFRTPNDKPYHTYLLEKESID
ncbi:MAG: GNAT family N-acetyltransferase [Bacilli bacterium]|nr:GNAT family N-acetyltransferase [Bacilli bacterium]